MHIVYLLIIMASDNGPVSTPQIFESSVACDQAAAFIINEGGTAKCVEDFREEE